MCDSHENSTYAGEGVETELGTLLKLARKKREKKTEHFYQPTWCGLFPPSLPRLSFIVRPFQTRGWKNKSFRMKPRIVIRRMILLMTRINSSNDSPGLHAKWFIFPSVVERKSCKQYPQNLLTKNKTIWSKYLQRLYAQVCHGSFVISYLLSRIRLQLLLTVLLRTTTVLLTYSFVTCCYRLCDFRYDMPYWFGGQADLYLGIGFHTKDIITSKHLHSHYQNGSWTVDIPKKWGKILPDHISRSKEREKVKIMRTLKNVVDETVPKD